SGRGACRGARGKARHRHDGADALLRPPRALRAVVPPALGGKPGQGWQGHDTDPRHGRDRSAQPAPALSRRPRRQDVHPRHFRCRRRGHGNAGRSRRGSRARLPPGEAHGRPARCRAARHRGDAHPQWEADPHHRRAAPGRAQPRRAPHAFHAGNDHRRRPPQRECLRPTRRRGGQGAGAAISRRDEIARARGDALPSRLGAWRAGPRRGTIAVMTIRQLPPILVNRIAAGEVVERPASAVKELVENAIDAGATRVEVLLRDGGQSLIVVSDDGHGMTREELSLAVERHCTSKLPDDDLLRIRSLGFRGEALPSIGAVSRLTLTSRARGGDGAWSLSVEGGAKGMAEPAAHPQGTRVEVRDLFYATPARLKFMKTPRAERDQAVDMVERLAMAYPGISFTVIGDEDRVLRRLDAVAGDLAAGEAQDRRRARLAAILGRDFAENVLGIDARREGLRLTGLAGLPTLNRATSRDQYLFVNGRPVRDKLLAGAVRGAYQDFLARDRHPMAALFLDCPED